MKREILFRGKRVDNSEWIYGCLINDEINHFIIPKNVYLYGNIHAGFIEVIPETVGQYTGLTDKNGTKIFEGDLVLCDSNRTCEVVWFEHNGQWDLNFVKELEITPKWTFFSFNDVKKRAEVIGNIYETK